MANKIYYKGKSYGEGGAAEVKPVEVAEDEIVIGDGEDWLKGSGIKVKESKVLLNDLFVEGEENPKIESIQLWNDEKVGKYGGSYITGVSFFIHSITIKNLTDDSKSKEIELNLDNISFGDGAIYYWSYLTYKTESDSKKTAYWHDNLVASMTKRQDGIYIEAEDGVINLANVIVKIDYPLEKDNSYEVIINTTSQKATFNITNCEEEISACYSGSLGGIKLTIDNAVFEQKTLTTDKSLTLNSGMATLTLKDNSWAEIKGNSTVSIRDGAHLSLGNDTRIIADGNSKIILHDGGRLDLGGDTIQDSGYWDGKTLPPQVRLQESMSPGLTMHQRASITADGAAVLQLHQAPNVSFEGNGSFVFGGTGNSKTGQYLSPNVYIRRGEIHFGGTDGESYREDGEWKYHYYDNSPIVYINSGHISFNSEFSKDMQATYAPFLALNGGGGISFNSQRINSCGTTPQGQDANTLYPYLACDPQNFQFQGCCIKNTTGNTKHVGEWDFRDAQDFLTDGSCYPRFKIGAATQMVIEGGDGQNSNDKIWIKIGSGEGYRAGGTHSVILNICNNPTIEFNHDASFMMKGYEKNSSNYYDHLYPQSKETYYNGPIFKMLGKPYFSMKDNVVIDFHNNRSPGNPTDYYLNFGLTSPQSTASDYQNKDANNTCVLTSRQIRKDLNYIWQSEIERGHAKDYLHLSVKPTETLAISSLLHTEKSILTEENLNHLFSEDSMGGNLYVAPPQGYSKTVVNSDNQVTLVDKNNTTLATVTKDENGVITVSSPLDTYAPTLCFRSESYNSTSFNATITTASDATYTLEMPISSSCILNGKVYSSYLPIGTLTSTAEERTLAVNGTTRIFENDYTETYLGSMNRYASAFTLGLDGAFGSNSNQCFLSVGGNAKIKLKGSLMFSSNTVTNSDSTHTTSITFTGAEDEGSVTFTIAELKALKALLS